MGPARILVVDDSPSVLRMVQNALGPADYKVETLTDATRTVDRAVAFRPDLLLLDASISGLEVRELCQKLHQDDRTASLRVVLMCLSTDVESQRLVHQLGVVDYITKPFSADAILALTSYTLERRAPSEHSSEHLILTTAADDDDTSDGEPTQVQRVPDEALTPHPRDESTQLRNLLVRGLQAIPAQAWEARLQEVVDEALRQAPPGAHGLDADAVLWGDLSGVPLPEVFQLMTMQGQTGLFQVWAQLPREHGPLRFDVYFSKGRMDLCHAVNQDEAFMLGRFLLMRGVMERTELEALLRARKGSGKLLGQQLVALGHITPEQLKLALRDQSCELVYELLRLRQGRFCLRRGIPPPREMAGVELAVAVDELLLEGLRRVDEWGEIEREVPDFDALFVKTGRPGENRLTPDEKRVLALVDGEARVRDIIRTSQMRPFDVCRLLYRLVGARLIRAHHA